MKKLLAGICIVLALVLLFPIALLMVLSIPAYAAETLLFLVTVHWSIVLGVDLVYVIRCR